MIINVSKTKIESLRRMINTFKVPEDSGKVYIDIDLDNPELIYIPEIKVMLMVADYDKDILVVTKPSNKISEVFEELSKNPSVLILTIGDYTNESI